MHTFDLRRKFAEFQLHEIRGRETTVTTTGILELDTDTAGVRHLLINIAAADPEMLNLVASAPTDTPDRWLYEEDILQLALQADPAAEKPELLLVNPLGKRKGTASTAAWVSEASRHAMGWNMRFTLPLPETGDCVGLSLHRFFRGFRGEILGLEPTLPEPVLAEAFSVLVIAGAGPAEDMAAKFRARVGTAAEAHIMRHVEAARARLAATRAAGAGRPRISLDACLKLAAERAAVPLEPADSFLCWNEGHFQGALLNVWELTGDRRWIETAVARAGQVWQFAGAARGQKEALWNRELPTWYNARETGTACTLVSGVIMGYIARLMRTVHEDARLADLRPLTAAWLPACEAIVALHEPEWIEFADGSGMHLEPYHKGPRRVYPGGGSRINPLNREFFLSMAMLDLWRLNDNPEYLRKVKMNAAYFRRVCDWNEGHCVWEYETTAVPGPGEDISHAAVQVRFAEACCRAGIEFGESDLRCMAATLKDKIFKYHDVPCGRIRGYEPGLHLAAAAWAGLCRFEPEILPRLTDLVETCMFEASPLFKPPSSWGVSLLSELLLARRLLDAGTL